ncbi:unnamed protein product [Blumeria hordei]|uniref:NADP-dependent oxidoreductase domain-containing protein n=1 Tax=Blumeria hordei TaxID=2867405 RepID=A0A383UWX8_BLUHO|nr:unnamed protein product [Blumeria hordei]
MSDITPMLSSYSPATNHDLLPHLVPFFNSTLMSPHIPQNRLDLKIDKFIYGTAWKQNRTALLVYEAIKAGFRSIDTGALPKHYDEKQTGIGIYWAMMECIVQRKDLHIQTKFVPMTCQDEMNVPYNPSDHILKQIQDSIISSLQHFSFPGFGTAYIDSLVLHSPLSSRAEIYSAWRFLDYFVPFPIKSLGLSNMTVTQLQDLIIKTGIRPCIIQNRFYRYTRWEVQLRNFCRNEGIIFQSFWTLTANYYLCRTKVVREIAQELYWLGVFQPEIVALYALVLGLDGISIMNGTTNPFRMKADLDGLNLVSHLVMGEWKEKWVVWVSTFKTMISDFEWEKEDIESEFKNGRAD